MSKIEELIKQYCPNGVRHINLGDCTTICRGARITKGQLVENGSYPVISGGISPMGYLDKYNREPNTITVSQYGTAGYVGWQNDYFWANDVCYSVYPNNEINNRFLWYCLTEQQPYIYSIRNNDAIPSSLAIESLKSVKIPLPPLPIQEKIAEILDKFSLLTAELEAELDLQKKRYDYYRNRILSFDSEPSSNSVQWRPLGKVGTFTRGRRFVRTDIVTEGQPCIHYGDMYTYYGLEASETKTHLPKDFPVKLRYADKGDVIIVAAGENDLDIGVGVAWTGNEPVAVHDACYIFKSDMNPKYVAHYLRTEKYHQEIRKYVSSAKICAISSDGIGKAMFPVRPLKEQERIVNILDRFEALVTNLSNGLPAEIERVRKQYEYYRNKLLTFPIAEQ